MKNHLKEKYWTKQIQYNNNLKNEYCPLKESNTPKLHNSTSQLYEPTNKNKIKKKESKIIKLKIQIN